MDAGRLDIGVDNTHTLSSGRENRSQVRGRVGRSRATAKGVERRNDWHLCMPSDAITCADRRSERQPGRVTVRSGSSLVKGHAHRARHRECCAATRRARSDVVRPSPVRMLEAVNKRSTRARLVRKFCDRLSGLERAGCMATPSEQARAVTRSTVCGPCGTSGNPRRCQVGLARYFLPTSGACRYK